MKNTDSSKCFLSGQKFNVTGWYKLINHNPKCFIPIQSNRMLFKKNEVVPKTGSCEHIAEWKLIEVYHEN